MNTLTIPYGGFLAVQSSGDPAAIKQQLATDAKAQVVEFADGGVVLAAWSQFPGQGLWQAAAGAVAYDLQLTNVGQLAELVTLPEPAIDLGELIFSLYRKFGPSCCNHLRGAFAFALWDASAQQLLVVTDSYGIRPVVFTQSPGLFAAASRIRLLECVGLKKEINPEAIYHYLFFQAICGTISIYKDVQKLEAGKSIRVVGNEVSLQSWYDLSYQPLTGRSEADWCQAIRQQVGRAVEQFVPPEKQEKTGCFLSGGTDSSSIVGFYAEKSRHKVKTFSIGFADPKYNELDFARTAVSHFQTDSYEYLVTAQDVLQLISDLAGIYDEPLGNASVVAAYYCARLAREQGVDLMLGGDGGDEIFGGNERYVTNLVFRKYADLPGMFRKKIVEPLLQLLPATGIFQQARRYVRRANFPNPYRFYSYNLLAEIDNTEIFQPDFLASVDTGCFFSWAQQLYDRAAPADDTDRLMYIDMKNTITDNDLRKVTQMVEAAGVQVAYPLLDRDLVDFTCTIPAALKVKPGKNRYIFKQALRGFLPEKIITKSKHGMGLPIAKWLRDDQALNGLLEENLFSPATQLTRYVRPEYLQELRDKLYTEDSPYYGDNLWVFLVLELWLREHLSSTERTDKS